MATASPRSLRRSSGPFSLCAGAESKDLSSASKAFTITRRGKVRGLSVPFAQRSLPFSLHFFVAGPAGAGGFDRGARRLAQVLLQVLGEGARRRRVLQRWVRHADLCVQWKDAVFMGACASGNVPLALHMVEAKAALDAPDATVRVRATCALCALGVALRGRCFARLCDMSVLCRAWCCR